MQAEVRRREEKEAAEALRRKQELEEAQRQQKRLDFLIKQTELYSHFMQNKTNSQPPEALPVSSEKTDDQLPLGSSEAVPGEDEDSEDAELNKEAWRVAQDAVSKQKQLTSAFDNECSRLRDVGDIEAASQIDSVAGSSNIDLQTP